VVQLDAPKAKRAAPLPPEERRAAILTAALPLVQEHGRDVTTKAIAEAAGVAEGTIFGVFPDKHSLILAALRSAFQPESGNALPRVVDPEDDLRERLITVIEIMGLRFEENKSLVVVAQSLPAESASEFFGHLHEARHRLMSGIAQIIEPDRDRLRTTPETAARLLLSIVFATRHSDLGGDALTAEEIVDVLLDGLLVRPTTGDTD
jgi:AcrR family transcriptional regulator